MKKQHYAITWVKGEEQCRWKGMHSDEYTRIIGAEELYDIWNHKKVFLFIFPA